MIRTRVLPVLMVLVGLAIVVRTVLDGGGPVATGVVVGALFVAAGALRLYAETRRR